MSEQKQHDADAPLDMGRMLNLGNMVLLVLTFLIAVISLIAIFAIRSDIASLEEQVRKVAKSTKSLQEEVAAIQEGNQVAKTKAPTGLATPPRPVHIDAADPSQDCVIRPGDAKSLSTCIGAATPGR
ncbi:MAG: hypothetical protein OEL88_15135 [Sterolibacteriaceae bacterium MAG5]|nr:hypothetical protein [Candidatus Nitricoxidireducens bremensis]